MTDTPKHPDAGRTVYSLDGRKAVYIQPVNDGHLVAPFFTFEGHDGEKFDIDADAYDIWKKVFPKPPKAVVSQELLDIKAKVAEETKRLADIRTQAYEAQRDHDAMMKRLARFEPLKNLEAVMDGQFAYVVEGPKILTFAEAMIYRENYDRSDAMRLLTLKPDENGTIMWWRSAYKDGSGGNDAGAVLCQTMDEAQAAVADYFIRQAESFERRYGFETAPHMWAAHAKSAKKAGVELPPEFLALADKAEKIAADRQITQAREALAKAEGTLRELEAKAGAS